MPGKHGRKGKKGGGGRVEEETNGKRHIKDYGGNRNNAQLA